MQNENTITLKTAEGEVLRVVNMTPHDIHVYQDDQRVLTIPRSGMTVRVTPQETPLPPLSMGGVEVPSFRVEHGTLTYPYVPEEREVWVVSSIILHYLRERGTPPALQGRVMFISPDTSPRRVVRDAEGNIIGVRAFNQP